MHFVRRATLSLAVSLLLASAAEARQDLPLAPDGANRAFAEALVRDLRDQDHAAALALIEARPDIAATPAGLRLRAELLAKLGRANEAVALLESHLTQDDQDALARYQLGEIHFLARRDRAASLAYRLALAGRLDPARRSIALARLSEIEARRDLRLSFSASLAPDSNINGATNATSIELFGLPFTLSDEARRQGGVSSSVGASVERRWRLSDRLALSGSGSAFIMDAPGRAFDQSQWAVQAGPELRLTEQVRLDIQARYRRIQFGGAPLEDWTGLETTVEAHGARDLSWDLSAHIDRITSRRGRAFDGLTYGAAIGRTRYLGPSALWRASLAVDAHDLESREVSYVEARLAAGRLAPLPFSLLVYVEPYVETRRFASASKLFGRRREDRSYGVSARFSRRDLRIWGAFPFAQLTISKATSNVALGSYARQRLEFGFTRDF